MYPKPYSIYLRETIEWHRHPPHCHPHKGSGHYLLNDSFNSRRGFHWVLKSTQKGAAFMASAFLANTREKGIQRRIEGPITKELYEKLQVVSHAPT